MANDIGLNFRHIGGDHANTFEFFDKNSLNNVYSLGCRFEPI